MRNIHGLVVVCTALAAAALLGSCSTDNRVGVASYSLPLDGEWSGEFTFDDAARIDFSLELPDDAVLARVTLECPDVALEFHAQEGAPLGELSDAPWSLAGDADPKEFTLDRLDPDRVAGATWYFAAAWPFEGLPHTAGGRRESVPVSVRVETFRTRVDSTLVVGVPIAAQLDRASGGFRTFKIDVPADARTLRLDLFDVTSDLDLYARHGGPLLALDEDVAACEHNWGHETLVITRDTEPALRAGEWYVDVVDALRPQAALPFKLLATFDSRVPPVLQGLPRLPRATDSGPLSRALAAVVEVATDGGIGSGSLLSSDGWILTNEHVVGADFATEIVVSITLDPSLPARESFRARTIRLDVERDLALLKIESGLYDQTLPTDYAFPTIELGNCAELSIGDPLWVVGYPATGGSGSRVSINATRGVVAGFERADFGVLIKTDAEITGGNSGGAALDAQGRLIGVPTSTIENGSGQIGYVHPIDALPAEWRALVGMR